jgi:4-amino-4-deoxy-L-arabinose transferase-like glycosyltransferase
VTVAASKSEQLQVWSRAGLLRHASVLLPLVLLIGTGLRGLDFGLHWDERPWQIGPVKQMVRSGTLLPGYYTYPSFDYWLNLLVLAPDAAASPAAEENLREHLLRALDSPAYLLRLRAVYLLITSLSLVWVYLLVLQLRGSWLEALFAASLLACSWEVAYHLRWVATDGMLMQFAALTGLLAVHALKSRRDSWLMAAAAAAGLGCGTKYPGGLLVLPVVLAGLFGAPGCTRRVKVVRFMKVATVFALVYLAVTPGTILQPVKFAHGVLYELTHYATGHGGHTVGRGLEHMQRLLMYFATVLFSPYLAIALLMFALAIIGTAGVIARDWRQGAVFVVFPLAYMLYFSTQGTMVVRNLLAMAPFWAIAAARGAGMLGQFLERNRFESTAQLPRPAFARAVWVGLLCVTVGLNTSWLIASAESIVSRHTDRFVREASQYVRTHPDTKFLLSPRIKRDLIVVGPSPQNITDDPGEAHAFVLYAREGMLRWHDWPANRRGLTQACFGPREVNFDMYPNWWGDDRIVVIDRLRATEIGLRIAGVTEDARPASEPLMVRRTAKYGTPPTPMSADSLPTSWTLPADPRTKAWPIDPRMLVPRAEAEAIMGPLVRGPTSGGWELDGTACTYLSYDRLLVSVAIISTKAFDLERHDPQSVTVSSDSASAYAARTGPLGEVRLFSRSVESAVLVHVSGDARPQEKKLDLAEQFARPALDRLDAAQDQTQLAETTAFGVR